METETLNLHLGEPLDDLGHFAAPICDVLSSILVHGDDDDQDHDQEDDHDQEEDSLSKSQSKPRPFYVSDAELPDEVYRSRLRDEYLAEIIGTKDTRSKDTRSIGSSHDDNRSFNNLDFPPPSKKPNAPLRLPLVVSYKSSLVHPAFRSSPSDDADIHCVILAQHDSGKLFVAYLNGSEPLGSIANLNGDLNFFPWSTLRYVLS